MKAVTLLGVVGFMVAAIQIALLYNFYFFNGSDPGHTFSLLAIIALGSAVILKRP